MTEDREVFQCSECSHEFEHEAGEPVQCPQCGYESGVFPMSMIHDDGPKPKRRKRIGRLPIAQNTLIWVGIPVVSILVLVAQLDQCGGKQGPPKETPSQEQSHMGTGDLEVRTLAENLAPGKTLEELHKAFFALSSKPYVTRGTPWDIPRDPLPPYRLAKALIGENEVTVRPFEWGLLFGDMARSLDHSIDYVIPLETPHAVSDVNRRELSLLSQESTPRVFNPWTGVISGEKSLPTPLSIAEVAAMADGIASLEWLEKAELEKAIERLNGALETLPKDPGLKLIEGQLALAAGRSEEGIQRLSEAVQLGKDAHSHFVLGTAYLVEDSLFKAYKEFEAATEKAPGFAEAWLALGGVELRRMEMTPKAQHDALLGRVTGFLEKAKIADEDLEGLAPARAQVALLKGEETTAKEILVEATKRFPERPDPAVLLAQLAFQNQQLEEALSSLEMAAKADPAREDIRELMGMACAGLGQWKPCVGALQLSLEKAPEDPLVRLQLASAMRELGMSMEAKRTLLDHMKKFPEDATGPLLLAQLHLDDKEAEKALPHIEKGLLLSPVTEAYVLEFIAHQMLGDRDEAMAVVARLGVKNPNAHTLMTQALLEQGRMEDAKEVLLSWRNHKPTDQEAPVLLAMVHEAMGETTLASTVEKDFLATVDEAERESLRAQFKAQRQQVAAMLQGAVEVQAD
jgi:tetratricopeptide (TPR) repeat protein